MSQYRGCAPDVEIAIFKVSQTVSQRHQLLALSFPCSERTKQMSRIWKEVFGTQADRVVVVAQGQAVWPITSSKVLSCR
jgi:hypothetical protein